MPEIDLWVVLNLPHYVSVNQDLDRARRFEHLIGSKVSENRSVDSLEIESDVAIGVVGALIGGGLSGPLFQKLGAFPMALILGVPAFIAGEL